MLLEAWWSHSWPGSVSELRPPVPGASPWVSASSSQDRIPASPFLPTQIQASKKLQNGRPGPEVSGPSTLGRSGQGEGEGPGRGKGTQSACGCWQSLKGPVPTTRTKEPQDIGSLRQPSSWPLRQPCWDGRSQLQKSPKPQGSGVQGGRGIRSGSRPQPPYSQEASPAPHPFPPQEAGWISQDPVGKTEPRAHAQEGITVMRLHSRRSCKDKQGKDRRCRGRQP